MQPSPDGLAQALAELDGGADGVVTNSGMAAIDLCLNLTKADDLIIAPHDCYGGTHRLLTHRAEQGRIRVEFVDQSDDQAMTVALMKRPALVMIESPSNPLMRLVDVAAICTAAKAKGAITVVDNTFLSPLRMRPLDLGADIALQSTTKYINGHSDIIGGVVVAKDAEVAEKLAWWANCAGVTGAAFDAFQTMRGMRTLALRLDAAEANATAIAKFLKKQKSVTAVNYPGLKSDPGHKLMKAQQSGPGAMLSFEVTGGLDAATTLCQSLSLFKLAASLGGVESLICLPETMTHRGMAEEARRKAGISDSLLRISVGIESESDLLADLKQGLSAIS